MAGEVVQVLNAGEDPADSLTRLQAVLNIALKSIEQYAPTVPDTNQPPINTLDPALLARLFTRMHDALNTDSLTVINPILAELDNVLLPAQLTALHLAIENFDFREAEGVIRILANDLNILMEP